MHSRIISYNVESSRKNLDSVLRQSAFVVQGNKSALAWEEEFMRVIHSSNRTLPHSVKILAVANRSYNDALQEVLDSNMTVLFSGRSTENLITTLTFKAK
jgi:hypothetical protein